MTGRLSPRLTAGVVTLLVWALAAGSALFWVLRLGPGTQPPAVAVAGGPPAGGLAVDTRAVARALGASGGAAAATAAPAADVVARLALRGIVTQGGRGAALIAVDGKAPRPVRVGATLEGVEGGWTLRSLSPHAAVLAAEGREARLEMPPLSQRSSAGDAVAPGRVTRGAAPFTPALGQLPQQVVAPAPVQRPLGG